MNARNIIAILLALGVGYVLWVVLKWVIGLIFTVTFALLQIVAIAVIAVPVFFLIRNRLKLPR
ncbi:MAG: hypothetical protein FGM33_06035 [Candidatus Kapabacteria bacterium]|nr:hypothetical protein [Candidatus Kapabacteria bacterium]